MSIISICSIRSLCIDSLTVIDICSSKFCMNKYILYIYTSYIYITYKSSYLIICHISIYLCNTALVYLCSCRINMHIYIYLLHISLKHSQTVSVQGLGPSDVLTSACLVHGITHTAPLILVSSLLLLGFARATSLQLFQKMTKSHWESQRRRKRGNERRLV